MDILNKHFLRGLISTGLLEGGRGESAKIVAKNSLQAATALLSAVSSIDSLKDQKILSAIGKASAGYLGVRIEEKIMKKENSMNDNKSNQAVSENNLGASNTFLNKQFFVGVMVGGAATYILMNPKIRAKLIKSVTELWETVTSEFEEIKEQVADAKAEVHASNSSENDELVNDKKTKKVKKTR